MSPCNCISCMVSLNEGNQALFVNWNLWRRTFDMHIIQIANDADKKSITRNILEELPEWFGIPEAREEYIRDSAGKVFFCAM